MMGSIRDIFSSNKKEGISTNYSLSDGDANGKSIMKDIRLSGSATFLFSGVYFSQPLRVKMILTPEIGTPYTYEYFIVLDHYQ